MPLTGASYSDGRRTHRTMRRSSRRARVPRRASCRRDIGHRRSRRRVRSRSRAAFSTAWRNRISAFRSRAGPFACFGEELLRTRSAQAVGLRPRRAAIRLFLTAAARSPRALRFTAFGEAFCERAAFAVLGLRRRARASAWGRAARRASNSDRGRGPDPLVDRSAQTRAAGAVGPAARLRPRPAELRAAGRPRPRRAPRLLTAA